jgi:beta-lactamase superfamily II metal-dependent hydrolase
VLLLSVAAGDKDGRPDRETLETIQGYTLLRTDQNGWIQLSTDGGQMWVEVEKR